MSASVISEYRYQRRVQFYETDAAGIAHFSSFFRYMEEAEHAMWRAVGLSIAPHGATVGWARVSASCDYHKALRFEDEFEVWIRVAAITNKTIRYICTMTRGETTIATGAMTIIAVRTVPNQPIKAVEMPPEVAAAFRVAADVGVTSH